MDRLGRVSSRSLLDESSMRDVNDITRAESTCKKMQTGHAMSKCEHDRKFLKKDRPEDVVRDSHTAGQTNRFLVAWVDMVTHIASNLSNAIILQSSSDKLNKHRFESCTACRCTLANFEADSSLG